MIRQGTIFGALFIVWLAGAGELHAAGSRCVMTPERIEEVAARLPEGVESESVKAAYKNGILTVTVPKPPEAKPEVQSIPVSVE